ncbi:formyltetrahydrofolate deformylase [Austwickia chelonae]|uniref:Formyltetrahydrofolate deformylase n=1 Tax=Austwickia chelonae NBRC 105200 TaxID=1184607 RepID=K6VM25_9MICO|nr:formyltetrahydrofolate deformylase [Austwickia chelonae]GAB77794.1 formyltetrahydrofolate deformylase [Austwickia chelonae NBRC 105200]SEV89642.1 formyltetrahydrofolate deformylase [Austwickia chelonae]
MTAYILTFSCENHPGIVAAVTTTLTQLGCDITDGQQFDDRRSGRFFARMTFTPVRADLGEDGFRTALSPVLSSLGAEWKFRAAGHRPRVLLLASKTDHCLVDLLYRVRIGELAMDVVGIVSNHPRDTYGDLGDIPFHHLPVTKETKPEQEAQILRIIEDEQIDLVVLARYMQILSEEFAAALSGRCINIHHSFLPGFKGAKPYHQAYERGVKLIGATAHYVTADLDEGPIIAQDVEPVTHRDGPETLVRKGRDIERRVLASAVRAHIEDRVMMRDSTTIVFSA